MNVCSARDHLWKGNAVPPFMLPAFWSDNTDSSVCLAVDPWFNFRATKHLVQHGFYSFWDWFDDRE